MYSKCHKLYAKVKPEPQRDEYGRVTYPDQEEWSEVCDCRCDDADDREVTTPNGELVRPAYHIVCEGNIHLDFGTEVRCMLGEIVRGEGTIKRRKNLNFLPYTELWV